MSLGNLPIPGSSLSVPTKIVFQAQRTAGQSFLVKMSSGPNVWLPASDPAAGSLLDDWLVRSVNILANFHVHGVELAQSGPSCALCVADVSMTSRPRDAKDEGIGAKRVKAYDDDDIGPSNITIGRKTTSSV